MMFNWTSFNPAPTQPKYAAVEKSPSVFFPCSVVFAPKGEGVFAFFPGGDNPYNYRWLRPCVNRGLQPSVSLLALLYFAMKSRPSKAFLLLPYTHQAPTRLVLGLSRRETTNFPLPVLP